LKRYQNEVEIAVKRPMRVVLMGGLGNQLFQYAFALSLSNEFDAEVIIDPNFAAIRLDESGLPEINRYQIDTKVTLAKSASYPIFIKKLVGSGIRISLKEQKILDRLAMILINRILEVCLSVYFRENFSIVFGRDNGFDKRYTEKKYSLYIGYFQSHKFSSATQVRDNLNALKPKVSSAIVATFTERAAMDKPLIVHVRLTDYRNEANFGIPSKDYYERAISFQLQSGRYKKIWLLSDEPEVALEFLPAKYRRIVENVSAENLGTVETLEVMRLGRGYVIANSSFSWWGAYLSYNTDVHTIYPNPWFSGMPTPDHLSPSDWLPFTR
jgi:hypothetical protein